VDPAPITELLLESMADHGLPSFDDLFSSGETHQGSGHVVRTVQAGIRRTGADFLKGAGENLHILTETTVDKVNLTCEVGEWRSTGVDIVGKDGTTRMTITARKEVVVSGGAYCSPAILLRSGIGAKEEVENLGIESKIDLPGVGKNLLDHPVST
jgi:choline dehydrogenase-like flavoprotein